MWGLWFSPFAPDCFWSPRVHTDRKMLRGKRKVLGKLLLLLACCLPQRMKETQWAPSLSVSCELTQAGLSAISRSSCSAWTGGWGRDALILDSLRIRQPGSGKWQQTAGSNCKRSHPRDGIGVRVGRVFPSYNNGCSSLCRALASWLYSPWHQLGW